MNYFGTVFVEETKKELLNRMKTLIVLKELHKAVGVKFNEHSGMDSLYVNICILREASKTITNDKDVRKSIFKTILQVWKENGIWINEER